MTFPPRSTDPGRRKFTAEEDDRLRNLVLQFGSRDWVSISRHMYARNPRQCRHRYNNYLIDQHQLLPWTEREEEMLIATYQELGPKWVQIATRLPGRTGNDVKNRWHKHILKKHPLAAQLARAGYEREASASASDQALSDAPYPFDEGAIPRPPPRISPFLQLVLNEDAQRFDRM
jgi:hypothetical protein